MRPIKTAPDNGQGSSFNFSAVYRGALITLIVSLIFSIFLGLIYYLTGLSETSLPWTASGILCLSVLIGSGYAAAKARVKGLYHGIGTAIIYFILVWIIAALFLPSIITLAGFGSKFALTVICGAVGGMLGVSLSS